MAWQQPLQRLLPLALLPVSLGWLATTPATAKQARCVVKEAGVTTFQGRCDFQQFGGNGSFSIGPIGQPFIAGRLVLSVTLVSPETAEVRGLTQDGINSRWGPARRSARDRACWDGSDFQICAY